MKKLGFGLMRLPLVNPEDNKTIDHDVLCQMVDTYMNAGFTHFDTAYMYHSGVSEAAFKEAVVKRYPREQFTVTDKMPMSMVKEEAQLEAIFSEQLERCGVDHFDYYWLHALGAKTAKTSDELHAFKFIAQKKAEGKILNTGFSFHDSAEVLDEILTNHPEVDCVQLQINYLDWEDDNVQARKCYEVARKHHKRIFIMEPVKGGKLAILPPKADAVFKAIHPEASAASWAIRFAASLEGVECVLSGMSTWPQLDDNTSFMKDFVPLSDEEMTAVWKVAEMIRENVTIPCTACRYCTDGCPMNIAIPEYFAVYNEYKQFDGIHKESCKGSYGFRSKDHGKASECIACGQCEDKCPQHIEIIEHLKTIAAEFEG